ncbi:MAG: SpoVG family protein [Acutalibacteraceae bacterium]
MLITSFRLRKIEMPSNRLVAKCTLTFDNTIAISDIKVLLKQEGEYYMGMPSRKTSAGTFKDEAYPVNSAARQALERVIFSAMKHAADSPELVFSGEVRELSDKNNLLEQDFDDFIVTAM